MTRRAVRVTAGWRAKPAKTFVHPLKAAGHLSAMSFTRPDRARFCGWQTFSWE